MRRWLLPALLFVALGCGRKEASQPEAVVQAPPAVVAEPEAAKEPGPVRRPPATAQPDAVPETAAVADSGRVFVEVESYRIITDEEFKRLPVTPSYNDLRGIQANPSFRKASRTLTGEEVERAGGIFEAVKTVPGVIGK